MSIYKSSSLAMIPTAYKDGKLYSLRPTDGSGDFTFTRCGGAAGCDLAATRVDVNGLIEKGRENLITYSNDFLNASWNKGSILSVTDGHSGYDGSNDASLVVPNTILAGHLISKNGETYTGLQTYSVYAKNGGYDLQLRATGIGSTTIWVSFDLTNGVVGTTGGGHIDSSITSLVGGWYRCSMTFTTAASPYIGIYQVPNGATAGQGEAFVGDGTSGLYIQDAQVEVSLVATDYIETGASTAQAGILEDMPRLDYSGGASCPSLLLEPQRSNLVDDYSGYTWDSFNGSAISFTGTEQSPEGFNNAVTWRFAGSSGEVVQRSSISISNSTTYTISGYFKLTSGTLTSGSNQIKGLDGLTGGSVSLNTLTNEWQRLSFSVTSSSTSGRVQLRCDNSATIQVYGLQLEAGSYKTSIIPTYGTSQTRSGDVCKKTGISSLIGQSEGTLFIDIVPQDKEFQIYYQARTTGSSNAGQIDIRYQSGALKTLGADGGASNFSISFGDIVVGQRYKCAVRYAENDVAFYVNGSLAGTDTSASFSSSTKGQITFHENTGSFLPHAEVKQALVFTTGLTNAELAALTTL